MGLDIFFTKHTEVGYFRKVNFLVRYFTDLGFDVDNQTPFHITQSMIKELIDRCHKVLNDHTLANELLPTMNGFFFGSTDYNQHYYDDVKSVLMYLEQKLLPTIESLAGNESIYFETWY